MKTEIDVPSAPPAEASRPRVSALDGYRAIAICGVMLNHALLSGRMPSGMKSVDFALRGGVVAFMVLSGYLVTRSLLAELSRHDGIDIPRFLKAQAVRLYIPVAFYLFFACLWFAGTPGFVWWRSIRVLWADPNSARSFVGAGHLYTLAAQLQFFIWWPLILRILPPGRRTWLTGAMAFLAVLWRTEGMAFAARTGGNDLRTDYVYAPLLVGAWWACLASAGRLDWILELARARSVLLGFLIFLIFATLAITRSPSTALGLVSPTLREAAAGWRALPFVGMTLRSLVSLGAMIAFAGLVFLLHRGQPAWLSRLFALPPLAALGRISFSVYLWQSVFCLGVTGTPADRFPLSLAFSIAFGNLAHRIAEVPSLRWRGALRRSGAEARGNRVRDALR